MPVVSNDVLNVGRGQLLQDHRIAGEDQVAQVQSTDTTCDSMPSTVFCGGTFMVCKWSQAALCYV